MALYFLPQNNKKEKKKKKRKTERGRTSNKGELLTLTCNSADSISIRSRGLCNSAPQDSGQYTNLCLITFTTPGPLLLRNGT